MNNIKRELGWFKSEPVRTYAYTVLVAVIGLAVAYGWLDNIELWIGLAAAVCGVEKARTKVMPVAALEKAGVIVKKKTGGGSNKSPGGLEKKTTPPQNKRGGR